MGDDEVHVAVFLEVGVDDLERGDAGNGLARKTSRRIDLKRERLAISTLKDVKVTVIIYVGPLAAASLPRLSLSPNRYVPPVMVFATGVINPPPVLKSSP